MQFIVIISFLVAIVALNWDEVCGDMPFLLSYGQLTQFDVNLIRLVVFKWSDDILLYSFV